MATKKTTAKKAPAKKTAVKKAAAKKAPEPVVEPAPEPVVETAVVEPVDTSRPRATPAHQPAPMAPPTAEAHCIGPEGVPSPPIG